MVKLKELLKESLSTRKASELKGQAKYLNNSTRMLMRFIGQKDEKMVLQEVNYILSKAKLLKEILSDKRYD